MKVFVCLLPLFFLVACTNSKESSAPLAIASAKLKIKKIDKLDAGSTLSFLITYSNDSKGVFKPEQKMTQATPPRYEIAAYVVSDLLGLGKVPVTRFSSFDKEDFLMLAKDNSKLKLLLNKRENELQSVNGKLIGATLTFVPDLIYPKIDSYGLDSKAGIQTWMHYLKAKTILPMDKKNLLEQISSTIVFDFVIGNQDRWSGQNILAQGSQSHLSLVLIDNAMSFGKTKEGHGIAKRYFLELQTFSEPLINKLKYLTQEKLDSAFAKHRGGFEYLVDKERREALVARAAYVVKRVEQMKDKRFF